MSNWSAPIMNRCHEPTQGKDMRTMLRRHGFQVYLLDKNRTSNACPSCYDGELNTFKKVQNPQPFRRATDTTDFCHGFLSYSNKK
ncbi:hypothetical protein BX070DRAFT_230431 [Coemansia spiralis]|nr:hypothetical protein BX070DRAFT_230431 [Coemansia spiralis]